VRVSSYKSPLFPLSPLLSFSKRATPPHIRSIPERLPKKADSHTGYIPTSNPFPQQTPPSNLFSQTNTPQPLPSPQIESPMLSLRALIAIACRLRQYDKGTLNTETIREEPERAFLTDRAEPIDTELDRVDIQEPDRRAEEIEMLVERMRRYEWTRDDCTLWVSSA